MLSDPTRRIPGASSDVFPPAVREAYRRAAPGSRGNPHPTGYFSTNTFAPEPLHSEGHDRLNDIDLDASSPTPRRRSCGSSATTTPSTVGVYEMIRYHLGLDGVDGPRGKRMRPLLGLLAYASIAGEHARALPGAAAVELGHNFSLVHDDIEDGDVERRHRADPVGAPRRAPGDQHRRPDLQPVSGSPSTA